MVHPAVAFVSGGAVLKRHENLPKRYLKTSKQDTVLARLMPGEIVIPVKHAKRVRKLLKEANITLPNMKQ